MNWDGKSDFQVNKRLAQMLGDYNPLGVKNVEVEMIGDVEYHRQCGGPYHATHLDYCNSWADMGPLIEEHNIDLFFDGGFRMAWEASHTKHIDNYDVDVIGLSESKSPLRAAAICLIKKLEAEQ